MTPVHSRPCPRDPLFHREGELRYRGVEDRLYHVPGQWDVRANDELFWLDPMPLPESIMHAYEDYHTHVDDAPMEIGSPARVGWYHALRRRVWAAQRARARVPWQAWLPPIREQLRFDRAFLSPREGGRLLDVGCGSGALVERLRELGWEARGIDPDSRAVARARAMGRPVDRAGVESLADMKGQFDAVTLFHVIEHVFEPMKVLSEVAACLRPGGRVVIVTPNAGSLCSRLFGRDWRGLEPPRHLQVLSRFAMERALRESGFVRVRVRTSCRDASGMFCASWAIRLLGRYTPGAAPARAVRVMGDVALAAEWVLTVLGVPAGEELVAVAERGS